MPKVSVILTSYNHAAYIAAAIESVLNQTFGDFELLIVDDGSQDNSHAIIKTFDDSRIKTFLYTENRGPVYSIAEAVNAAQGKYGKYKRSQDASKIREHMFGRTQPCGNGHISPSGRMRDGKTPDGKQCDRDHSDE